MSSSEWYRDAAAVIDQVRRAGGARGAAPVIAGYDDLVELRRGGQGIVYAATQRSTRRRVAIKLMLDGAFASDVSRRRFEREIELVGALRNPHIVRIYDSGVADGGHPYFVMEFVDGAPLDRYVIDSGLANPGMDQKEATPAATRARIDRLLKLFLPICEAVHHAHQHGVIHRDLKPANIRVDSDGAPRVLDFGLARAGGAANPAAADVTELTASGQFMGSLPWASPEHVSGNPVAIDTRSDTYSLGVVLYYLLTGEFPYVVQGALRNVLENIARAEPTRPSASAVGISADLDTIVLKSLAKEPDRRYQSAADLADDIRHFLADEPIQARRDSAWHTLGKRLQRYRWAVAAASLVVGVVVIALLVSLNQWRLTEQQREFADRERARADAQRQVAEQKGAQLQVVNDFLADTFSAADPAVQGKDVRVADVLDRAANEIDRKMAALPASAIAARVAIGRSFLALGLNDRADEQLSAAMRLSQAHLDPNSIDSLMCAQWLAGLRHQQGRYADAEESLRSIIDRSTQAWGANHDVTLRAKQSLANVLGDSGQFAEAESLTRQVLAARTQVYGADAPKTLLSMQTLATTLAEQGQLEEAQARLEELIAAQRRTQGEEHPDFIDATVLLAQVLGERNLDLQRGDDLLARAHELASKVFGVEHPRTLGILHDRAAMRGRLNLPEEAIVMLRQVLEAQTRVLGPDHPAILNTRCSLATELQRAGRGEEAIPLYREAAEKAVELLGPKHPQTLVYNNNYALALLRLRRISEAEPHLRDVYDTAVETLGEKHWKTAVFRGNLGRALLLQSRYDESEPHFLGSYDALYETLGDQHELTVAAACDLVELYEKWGKPDRAEPYRAKCANVSAR